MLPSYARSRPRPEYCFRHFSRRSCNTLNVSSHARTIAFTPIPFSIFVCSSTDTRANSSEMQSGIAISKGAWGIASNEEACGRGRRQELVRNLQCQICRLHPGSSLGYASAGTCDSGSSTSGTGGAVLCIRQQMPRRNGCLPRITTSMRCVSTYRATGTSNDRRKNTWHTQPCCPHRGQK
ncbi:hypothetical protein EDD17DRAFT_1611948 [Pisolithus thermaeus]|nr:hypothetical protein EDD17DRAFT_1611948 [Pisolithus thermaeus]